MKSAFAIFLSWILMLVDRSKGSESLSFSPPNDTSIWTTASYWHGTIPGDLLEESIVLDVYLNEEKGLLFYAMDHLYQTLWLEFENAQLYIKYYSFKRGDIVTRIILIQELYNLKNVEDIQLELKLSLSDNLITLSCNKKKVTVYYSPSSDSVNNQTLRNFRNVMKYPVPQFNRFDPEKANQTSIWIGNVPLPYTKADHFHGCVQSLRSGDRVINLTTSGERVGNMIETSCKHVCVPNPCQNGGLCLERWRGRFSCNCRLSKFSGKVCNESHGVEFDGNTSVNITMENYLQTFKLSFKAMLIGRSSGANKLFSIQFLLNQLLDVFIDNRGFLHTKFVQQDSNTVEATFRNHIQNNKIYTLVVDADINRMDISIAVVENDYVKERKTLSNSTSNLIYTKIVVGDSHTPTMNWMDKFRGCISNVEFTDGKKLFLWSSLPDFDQLPSCDKKIIRPPLESLKNSPSKSKDVLNEITTPLFRQSSGINSANILYGVIVALIIVIVIVICIVIYIRKIKDSSAHKKLIQTNERVLSFDTSPYSASSVPNSPPIQFKPPYQARSISYSSNIDKSFTSLPRRTSPTLAVTEDVFY